MKKSILILFLVLIAICAVKSQSNEKIAILKNNWDVIWDTDCLYSKLSLENMKTYGKTYFKYLDTIKYRDKTLGYIVSEFSKQFQLIHKSIYTGIEKLRPGDQIRTTHFIFQFKMNDSTMLEIHGGLNPYNEFYEENDSVAIETAFLHDSFAMDFIEVNINMYYQSLYNLRNRIDYEIIRKNDSDYALIEKHFPEIVKRIVEKK